MKTAALIAVLGLISTQVKASSLTSKTSYVNKGLDWSAGQCGTVSNLPFF
jgi:hypothetical protein